MPDTAVVWFRRDLRVRDLPALAHACREHERVVPLFVFDPALLGGRFRSHARTAWMLGCLEALDGELRARGGRLVLRHGRPQTEVRRTSRPRSAPAPCTSPTTSRASRGRATQRVEQALGRDGVTLVRHPGLYVADLPAIRTASGGPYTVYSPFLRAWKAQERRPVERAPQEIAMPRIAAGRLPSLRGAGLRRGAPRSSRTPPTPARRPPGARRAPGWRGRAWRATPSGATSWPSRPRASRPTCASAASRR